jgi:hypothetical protein
LSLQVESTSIELVRRWCDGLGIEVPPVPQNFGDSLRQISPHTFATRSLPWSPYLVEEWAAEAERGDVPDYLVIGHAGHGVNSYAVSYFLVHQNLQLFLQVGLGGVYMDGDQARRGVSAAFDDAEALVLAAEKAASRCVGLAPMLVVATEFYGSRWAQPTAGEGPGPTEVVDSAPGTGTVLVCLRAATNWFATKAGSRA